MQKNSEKNASIIFIVSPRMAKFYASTAAATAYAVNASGHAANLSAHIGMRA